MWTGIVYVAQGADYLELAIQSAQSLKHFNPSVPIEIFTDQECMESCFDIVRSIADGPTPKLACLPHTSFERTLYLDCDTIALAELDDLFEILNRFPMAVAHDVRRTSNLIRQHGVHSTPYAFPQMNAGVILYRRTPDVLKFLGDWSAHYRLLGLQRDQISLRDLLWAGDLRFYVLPPEFNLRRVTVLDAWEPLDARPTILHSHRLLQHLRHKEPRLKDVKTVLAAERLALKEEWRLEFDCGGAPVSTDPVTKFRFAETSETLRQCKSCGDQVNLAESSNN